MQNETLISLDLLDEVRTTLAAAYAYHDALDIIDSQRKMWPEKRNQALTLAIRATLEEVEGLVSRHVLAERDERRARRKQEELEITYTNVPPPSMDEEPMCDPGDHELDDDGYCLYCGFDEDAILAEQGGDDEAVDSAPEGE